MAHRANPPATVNAGRAIRLCFRVSPPGSSAVCACYVLLALVPTLNVLLLAVAVSAVANAVSASGPATGADVMISVALLIGLAFLSYLLTVLRDHASGLVRLRVTRTVTEDIVRKTERLDLASFQETDTYDRIDRASRDGGQRAYQLFTDFVSAMTGVLSLVGTAVLLFSWSPMVAVTVIVSPAPGIVASALYGRVAWRIEHERTTLRRRVSYLSGLFTTESTFREIRGLGCSRALVGRIVGLDDEMESTDTRLLNRRTLVAGGLGSLSVVATGWAIFMAAQGAIASGEVGRFAGFLAAITTVQSGAQGLFSKLGSIYEGGLFFGELVDFLNGPERDAAPVVPRPRDTAVDLDGVSFRYPGSDRCVLHDVDVHLPAGAHVVVVGPNGSGKSTIGKLIAGYYAPTEGRVRVGGVDASLLADAPARSRVAVLQQDFVRFDLTLRENVALGDVSRLSGSDDEIVRALERVGLGEWLRGLPAGLDTVLGNAFGGAAQLSGGQWQRIGLARALFSDADVMVLDEPAAALDSLGEKRVIEGVLADRAGRTTIVVAHRLSTARQADLIVCCLDGRIADVGRHAELLARRGVYAQMFALQAAGLRGGPRGAPPEGPTRGAPLGPGAGRSGAPGRPDPSRAVVGVPGTDGASADGGRWGAARRAQQTTEPGSLFTARQDRGLTRRNPPADDPCEQASKNQ